MSWIRLYRNLGVGRAADVLLLNNSSGLHKNVESYASMFRRRGGIRKAFRRLTVTLSNPHRDLQTDPLNTVIIKKDHGILRYRQSHIRTVKNLTRTVITVVTVSSPGIEPKEMVNTDNTSVIRSLASILHSLSPATRSTRPVVIPCLRASLCSLSASLLSFASPTILRPPVVCISNAHTAA